MSSYLSVEFNTYDITNSSISPVRIDGSSPGLIDKYKYIFVY